MSVSRWAEVPNVATFGRPAGERKQRKAPVCRIYFTGLGEFPGMQNSCDSFLRVKQIWILNLWSMCGFLQHEIPSDEDITWKWSSPPVCK